MHAISIDIDPVILKLREYLNEIICKQDLLIDLFNVMGTSSNRLKNNCPIILHNQTPEMISKIKESP